MIRELLQLLFPVRCAGCRILDADGFCLNCQRRLSKNPVLFHYPELRSGCCLGFYDGPLQKAVHALKFEQKRVIGKTLAGLLQSRILAMDWKPELIAPVPLAPARIRERGFNQARLLAKGIAGLLRLPCKDLLRANRKMKHQTGLGRKDRLRNVRGAFALRNPMETNRKTILLVDDVVTTGATLRECASALHRGGAAQIYGACIALEQRRRLPDGLK